MSLGEKGNNCFGSSQLPGNQKLPAEPPLDTWDVYHCYHLYMGKNSWGGNFPNILIPMTLGRSWKVVWCCAAHRKPPSLRNSIPKPP